MAVHSCVLKTFSKKVWGEPNVHVSPSPQGEKKRECMHERVCVCVCVFMYVCVLVHACVWARTCTHTCVHTHTLSLSPVREKGREESREHHLNVPTSVRLQLTLFSPEINTRVTCLAFFSPPSLPAFSFPLFLSQRRVSHYGLSHYVLYKYNRRDYSLNCDGTDYKVCGPLWSLSGAWGNRNWAPAHKVQQPPYVLRTKKKECSYPT